jgi:hypothetical protein
MSDTRPADTEPATDDPIMEAWGIIANARDWLLDDEQAAEWVEAAQRWRDTHLEEHLRDGRTERQPSP